MGWGTPRGRTLTAYVEAKTPEEGAALLKAGAKRGNKHHAIRTFYRDQWWDSKSEAAYTDTLEAMVGAGMLARWAGHPTFDLLEALVDAPASRTRHKKTELLEGFGGCPVTVEWDYQCWPDPVSGAPTCVLDRKGWSTLTEAFFLKAALWRRVHPGIPMYAVMPDETWIRA